MYDVVSHGTLCKSLLNDGNDRVNTLTLTLNTLGVAR